MFVSILCGIQNWTVSVAAADTSKKLASEVRHDSPNGGNSIMKRLENVGA